MTSSNIKVAVRLLRSIWKAVAFGRISSLTYTVTCCASSMGISCAALPRTSSTVRLLREMKVSATPVASSGLRLSSSISRGLRVMMTEAKLSRWKVVEVMATNSMASLAAFCSMS